jgi:YYY domain-containing protein
VETPQERLVDPVLLPTELGFSQTETVRISFTSAQVGSPRSLILPFVADLSPELGPKRLSVTVRRVSPDLAILAQGALEGVLGSAGETQLEIPLTPIGEVASAGLTEIEIVFDGAGAARLRGEAQLVIAAAGGDVIQQVGLPLTSTTFSTAVPVLAAADGHFNGQAVAVLLPYVRPLAAISGASRLTASLYRDLASPPVATGSLVVQLPFGTETRVEIPLDSPIAWETGTTYTVKVEVSRGTPLEARASVIILESSWDDGLPLGVDGRGFGGRYTAVVQEVYWPDDQDYDVNGESDKLERLVQTLRDGDLLAISSNRQFGSIPRVPIRYPLTTAYYRALLNCPTGTEVAQCADEARPGMISESLGFEVAAVFRSDPGLGSWTTSDQAAEEAFTVYDHPLVLLFRKTPAFSEARVRERLGQVDLTHIIPVLPKDAGLAPSDLLLPEERREAQRAGGTWSDLFTRDSQLFQSQALAALTWWVLIFLIGLAAWPLTRAAFPGLRDAGYPISRLVGLLLLAWGSWMLGSFRIAAHRPAILIVLAGVLAASAALAWKDRHEFSDFVRRHRREILLAEALALAFFLLDLGIRLGNPDLWHPSKGGEKPMDFSYLNAVLRSESFPPYDPWFAGGYINYYYFGFVIVGVPIQLLGMVPSVAYNLAIPTLFSLTALAAYCAARNLAAGGGERGGTLAEAGSKAAGIAAAVGLVVLGNLGTARMILEGWRRIGAEGAESSGFLPGLAQPARGLFLFFTLQSPMPYAMDSWYWDPSRAIPPGAGEVGPITEFPFFTFIYADLHAHMIALPLTVLGLTWGISWLLAASDGHLAGASGKRIGTGGTILSLGMGALIFGSLRPTNTWDFPVYLVLGAAAAAAAPLIRDRVLNPQVLTKGLLAALGLAAASVLLYLPYALWYGQGYTAADVWQGSRTDLGSYFTVHGLFLFIVLTWIGWEAIRWMAVTPMRALQRLRPWWGTLAAAGIIGLVAMIVLAVVGFQIALLAFPVVAVAGILILRPGQPIGKRIVLALVATGVALTFVVDVFVLRGDISRMNTVFKFYLQVWTLFSLSAAAALVWMLLEIPAWKAGWRRGWVGGVSLLVLCAALYPMIAAPAKMRDRMDLTASHSLDGMAFMDTAVYYDQGTSFPLAEDARAIRWLQENIEGTPVIVEAHIPEYRWGARMAIYTGLPTVLGWKHHQSQQRVVSGDPTPARAIEVSSFYLTASDEDGRAFLRKYGVEYVVVGRLERMYYGNLEPCLPAAEGGRVVCDLANRLYGVTPVSLDPAQCAAIDPNADPLSYRCQSGGMEKFDRLAEEGTLREVYRDGETVIYQVAEP